MIEFRRNVPLAPYTSYRIGGPAAMLCSPRSSDEIISALRYAAKEGIPVFVLGKGSNILVSDSGIDGLVIDTAAFDAIGFDGESVCAAGGALLHSMVKESVDRGLAGCGELAGIPGTIGGGIIMNAGAFSQTISDHLVSVEVVDSKGNNHERLTMDCLSFSYRNSSIREKGLVVLSATFRFPASDIDSQKTVFEDVLSRRRTKQPLEYPSCGSVFKRPAGGFAGTLIESCGLKGIRIGGAEVSEKHANFILNTGGASAADVAELIALISKKVFEKTGIRLMPEVIYVGDFPESLIPCIR